MARILDRIRLSAVTLFVVSYAFLAYYAWALKHNVCVLGTESASQPYYT